MIGKVVKGWDAKRLVKYLLSPGKYNEHTAPHVIAAWQGDPGALDPRRIGEGDFAYDPDDVAHLLEHVNAAATAAGLPDRQPTKGAPGYTKHGYVWHCPISIEATEGRLSFEQWAQIARDVMDRTGISSDGDAGGCRWIAVHHGRSVDGHDHIHIAAVLVRQDTGKRFYPKDDFAKVGAVMSEWETRLGLRQLHRGAQAGAASHPSRGENEKAQRRAARGDDGLGRARPAASARDQLRQVVIETAATSNSSAEFLASLREQGVLVHLRKNDTGKVTGYAVAAPGDTARRTGRPIFFGGGTLGPELTWGRLNRWWETAPTLTEPAAATAREEAHESIGQATRAARTAAEAVRERTEPAEPIARSVRDLLAAWAKAADGAGRRDAITRGSWAYERCARAAGTDSPAGQAAQELRRASARIARAGMFSGRGAERPALVELSLAVTALLLELAAYFEQSRQLAHAAASRASAAQVDAYGHAVAAPPRTTARAASRPRPAATPHTFDPFTDQRRHPNHRPWDPPGPGDPGSRPRVT